MQRRCYRGAVSGLSTPRHGRLLLLTLLRTTAAQQDQYGDVRAASRRPLAAFTLSGDGWVGGREAAGTPYGRPRLDEPRMRT